MDSSDTKDVKNEMYNLSNNLSLCLALANVLNVELNNGSNLQELDKCMIIDYLCEKLKELKYNLADIRKSLFGIEQ